jgi:hypothetical protein
MEAMALASRKQSPLLAEVDLVRLLLITPPAMRFLQSPVVPEAEPISTSVDLQEYREAMQLMVM